MLPPTFDDETDKVSLFSMWLLVAEGGRERERPLMDVVIGAVVNFLLGKGKGQRREGGTEATKQCGGKRPEERTAGCQKQGNRQLLKKGRGQKRERPTIDASVDSL